MKDNVLTVVAKLEFLKDNQELSVIDMKIVLEKENSLVVLGKFSLCHQFFNLSNKIDLNVKSGLTEEHLSVKFKL